MKRSVIREFQGRHFQDPVSLHGPGQSLDPGYARKKVSPSQGYSTDFETPAFRAFFVPPVLELVRGNRYTSRPLMRGGAVWQLVGLITRRSQVQILPPLPFILEYQSLAGILSGFMPKFLVCCEVMFTNMYVSID